MLTFSSTKEETYFAQYEPIRNPDGEIVGILFAGKPSTHIENVISGAMFPIIFVSRLASLGVGCLSIFSSRKIIFSIQRINNFLSQVAQVNLSMNLDSRVLTRKDELGDIDFFKKVNDTYGHSAGDVVLICVAVCQLSDKLNILVKYADDKLYKGKPQGRNRIVT